MTNSSMKPTTANQLHSSTKNMSNKIVNTSIEILGKHYSVRCPESELEQLRQAATYLNQQMTEVQESGKAINLERIAIISALNISYLYLQLDQQKTNFSDKINQHLLQLQDKLDNALNPTLGKEFII